MANSIHTMYINYTAFGKTKRVLVEKYNMEPEETEYDEVLWVERPEDYYALMSTRLKNKRVVIVKRDTWVDTKVV